MSLFRREEKNRDIVSKKENYQSIQEVEKELEKKQEELDKMFDTHEEKMDFLFKENSVTEDEDWFGHMVDEEKKKQL